jgi:hypothetical protein
VIHDPLCPVDDREYCECQLVARVRADERRHAEMAAVVDREVIADEVREQIALEIEALLGPNSHGGYADGVRDSVAIARGDA